MRVVICGGGLAGLSTAAFLRLSNIASSISIIESTARNAQDGQDVNSYDKIKQNQEIGSNIFPMQTGLWTSAMKLLAVDLKISSDKLPFVSVDQLAGYRNKKGDWMVRPHRGLSVFNGSCLAPSLSFVSNNNLVDCLKKYLERDVEIMCTQLEDIRDSSLTTADGHSMDFDLLVNAGGTWSDLKQPGQKGDTEFVRYQGYQVWRGFSKDIVCPDSFQTWGSGSRFAVVPSVHGGSMWYAAVSCKQDDRGKYTSAANGPFYNRSIQETKNGREFLQDHFKNWHQPISELIANSEHDIYRCPAYASSRPRLSTQSNVVAVGDAFYTFDPIMAIGAGFAIESAHALSQSLIPNKNTETVGFQIRKYEQSLQPKIRTLSRVSQLAQLVGHMNSKPACNVRDRALSFLPNAIKGYVMDGVIGELNGSGISE